MPEIDEAREQRCRRIRAAAKLVDVPITEVCRRKRHINYQSAMNALSGSAGMPTIEKLEDAYRELAEKQGNEDALTLLGR